MAVSGRRRVLPFDQQTFALRWLPTHCVGQPRVEPPTRFGRLWVAETSHVVVAVATAEEEYAFVSQRRECASQRDVSQRIERTEQGNLQDGQVCRRQSNHEWNESAVIE